MPTTTPNLDLKKPLGNEIFNRQAYNENLDLMDQNAAKKTVLDAHLADYTQEIKTDSKQSVTLPHGLSVLNAPRAVQLKPKFKGGQLVNLLGRDGNCEDVSKWVAINSVLGLDETNKVTGSNSLKVTIAAGKTQGSAQKTITTVINKSYLVAGHIKNGNAASAQINIQGTVNSTVILDTLKFSTGYLKFIATGTTHTLNLFVNGAGSQYGYFDGIRLYEITQAEYNEIDTLTPAQIAERYPYVDSFQCVQNPAVRIEGENLLDILNPIEKVGNTYIEDNNIVINATAKWDQTRYKIKAVPGQKYSINVRASYLYSDCAVDIWSNGISVENGGVYIGSAYPGNDFKTIFTTPSDCKHFYVVFYNKRDGANTITFSNPILVLGDKIPTEFKPYNSSHLYLQTPLYEGETLEEIDGNWMRNKKWEKKVLDGKDTIGGSVGTGIGWKQLAHKLPSKGNIAGFVASKYDGSILKNNHPFTAPDQTAINLDIVYIIIANTDSGWGENYTPTVDEIKAYFNGWRMSDVSSKTVPYSNGVKHWHKINKSEEASITTLPTSSYPEWTPYQLHYKLATPTTEVVPHEGELALHEGVNQVEVFEGVMVRELANPIYATVDGKYYINSYAPSNPLKYKTLKILDIFKNNNTDKALWSIGLYASNVVLGVEYASTKAVNFDPTAQYSVTYLALPEEFTASLLTVDATYDTNIKSTVDTLVDELAKVTTDVTALEVALRNKGLLRKSVYGSFFLSSQISVASSVEVVAPIKLDDGCFNVLGSSQLLIPEDGIYNIQTFVDWDYNNTGSRSTVIYQNNDTISIDDRLANFSSRSTSGFVIKAVKNDVIKFKVYQTSGNSLVLKFFKAKIVKVGD